MPAAIAGFCFNMAVPTVSKIMNTNINKAKTIAFVVHPDKKAELIEWSYFNRYLLSQHKIIATGEAANILQGTLNKPVTAYLMGPYEGYTELNAMIENGEVDAVIVLWSPDETPLQRNGLRSVIHAALEADIIIANNKTTANFIITSPLMGHETSKREKTIYQVKKHNAA